MFTQKNGRTAKWASSLVRTENASQQTDNVTIALTAKTAPTKKAVVCTCTDIFPVVKLYLHVSQFGVTFLCLCTSASWNADKVFQCYDGSVILRSRVCDGMADCQSKLTEDESQDCEASFMTCRSYWDAGFTTNGVYPMFTKGICFSF